MNKKILYGIFFISIFLLSTASMVQPVHGYEFGVPKEGIGTTSEGEIKLYDEDEWEDHLGGQSSADDVFDGDSDVVGAKSKTKIKELEEDEDLISYEKDHAWKDDAIPGSIDIELTIDSLIDSSVLVGGAPGAGSGMVAILTGAAQHSNSTYAFLNATYNGYDFNMAYGNATDNVISALTKYGAVLASPTAASWLTTWGKKYDGAYLTRDYWEVTEDAYKSKPDEKDEEVPYLADPRDWLNSYENTMGFKFVQQSAVKSIESDWNAFWSELFPFAGGWTMDGVSKLVYEQLNSSIVYVLNVTAKKLVDSSWIGYVHAFEINGVAQATRAGILQGYVEAMASPNMNWTAYIGVGSLWESFVFPGAGAGAGTYNDSYYVHDLVMGVSVGIDAVMEGSWYTLEYAYPTKAGHLIATLVSGQPVYVPQGDFMDKVVDTYDVDDDVLYRIPYVIGENPLIELDASISAIPKGTWASLPVVGVSTPVYDLGGETVYVDAYVDVSSENGVVTVGIEYIDGQLDPGDVAMGVAPGDLEDFEMVFVFGQYGSQESVTFKDGDTEFWKSGGIDQIPGFEISIILGASALSIIGLIFVVMKKRKR